MAALKIVALIGTPVYLNYFVNRIAEDHKIELVIRENVRGNIIKKIWQKGVFKSIKIIAKHFLSKNKNQKIYNEVFGSQWQCLNQNIPYFETENINSQAVVEQLDRIKPDLVVVQGTTLIKNKTLRNIPLVLNLHWGLSPYFKGSMCTEWAILNQNINNIGFTIHKISAKIDGGDIYTQGRLEIIEKSDNANSINMKLTRDGAAAMTAAIHKIKNGTPLQFVKQNDSIGNLYLVKHWTSQQEILLKKHEKEMGKTISNSIQKFYPIVVNGKMN